MASTAALPLLARAARRTKVQTLTHSGLLPCAVTASSSSSSSSYQRNHVCLNNNSFLNNTGNVNNRNGVGRRNFSTLGDWLPWMKSPDAEVASALEAGPDGFSHKRVNIESKKGTSSDSASSGSNGGSSGTSTGGSSTINPDAPSLPAPVEVQRVDLPDGSAAVHDVADINSGAVENGVMTYQGEPLDALQSLLVQFPNGSTALANMDMALNESSDGGIDLSVAYAPWRPVETFQALFITLHDNFGLSWFASAVTMAVLVRGVTFPIAVMSQKARYRNAQYQPLQTKLNDAYWGAHPRYMQAQNSGNQQQQEKIRGQVMQLNKQMGGMFSTIKPYFNLLVIQMPLMICAFRAMRGIAHHPHLYPSIMQEGVMHLDSLGLPDPTWTLPVFGSLVMASNVFIFGNLESGMETTSTYEKERKLREEAKWQSDEEDDRSAYMQKMKGHMLKYGPKLMCLIPVTILSWQASIMMIYYSTSFVCTFIQQWIFNSRFARTWLELPVNKNLTMETISGKPLIVSGDEIKKHNERKQMMIKMKNILLLRGTGTTTTSQDSAVDYIADPTARKGVGFAPLVPLPTSMLAGGGRVEIGDGFGQISSKQIELLQQKKEYLSDQKKEEEEDSSLHYYDTTSGLMRDRKTGKVILTNQISTLSPEGTKVSTTISPFVGEAEGGRQTTYVSAADLFPTVVRMGEEKRSVHVEYSLLERTAKGGMGSAGWARAQDSKPSSRLQSAVFIQKGTGKSAARPSYKGRGEKSASNKLPLDNLTNEHNAFGQQAYGALLGGDTTGGNSENQTTSSDHQIHGKNKQQFSYRQASNTLRQKARQGMAFKSRSVDQRLAALI